MRSVVMPEAIPPSLPVLAPSPDEWVARPLLLYYHARHEVCAPGDWLRQLPVRMAAPGGAWKRRPARAAARCATWGLRPTSRRVKG